jgi:hypothetical protein
MFTAFLVQDRLNSRGLPKEIINDIVNNVPDYIAAHIASWGTTPDGGYEVKVEKTQYYEAVLPNSAKKRTLHTILFGKDFKRRSED